MAQWDYCDLVESQKSDSRSKEMEGKSGRPIPHDMGPIELYNGRKIPNSLFARKSDNTKIAFQFALQNG